MDTGRLFAFGDSIMKGVVFDGERHHTTENCFASILSHRIGKPLINCAKMGHTIADGWKMFERHRQQLQSGDTALIEFGGNDCDFPWAEIGNNPDTEHSPRTMLALFKEKYTSLIATLKGMGVRPLLFSLPPLQSERYFHYFTRAMNSLQKENIMRWLDGNIEFIANWHEHYNLAIYQIGAFTNTQVIDISSCFLSHPDYHDYICSDGIHPNEQGHRLIAAALAKMDMWLCG